MYQIKQMLDDLVEYTFPEDPKKKSYKAFYVQVMDKDFKSRHGDYHRSTRTIRLMNSYRDENKLIETAIHELAHHINAMQGNVDVHGKGFYANYEKLLHRALDMKILTKAFSKQNDGQGDRKVAKMIESYRPRPIDYKNDKRKVIVYDAFDYKDDLKFHGFHYNKIVKGWELDISESEVEKTRAYLETKKLNFTITDASRYIVKSEQDKGIYTICALKAYDIKDKLRERGYRYRQTDQGWYIRCDEVDKNAKIKEIEEMCEASGMKIVRKEQGSSRYETILTLGHITKET